ncbi:MAG: hypothetical protein ACYTG0_12785 [Planctomycetota bacterium]|jgi:hypothetical protein
MPILIEVSDDAPLTQGDILKDVSLFATDSRWLHTGGQVPQMKSPVCMVLSRPCAILNKPQIIVASVECVKGEIPRDLAGFEKVRQFLEQLRDGGNSPDRFYLGQQIPTLGQSGRFFARFDSLHTVKMPDSDTLAALLPRHRVATLADEFRRDLHRRIFSAFAALGFDDYAWYSDQDLDWVISAGQKELSDLRSEIRGREEQIHKNVSSGQADQNKKIKSEVENLKSKSQKVENELAKYERERAKRQGVAD